jgi:hypothetical protein
MSLFQDLMKTRESTNDVLTEADLRDHPEVAVDIEVRTIPREGLTTSADVDAPEPVLRGSTDGTNQAEEVDV